MEAVFSGWQSWSLAFPSSFSLGKSLGAALPALGKPCLSFLFYLDYPVWLDNYSWFNRPPVYIKAIRSKQKTPLGAPLSLRWSTLLSLSSDHFLKVQVCLFKWVKTPDIGATSIVPCIGSLENRVPGGYLPFNKLSAFYLYLKKKLSPKNLIRKLRWIHKYTKIM